MKPWRGQFEESLKIAFAEEESNMPIRLLAHAITGTYNRLILAWFMEENHILTAQQLANHIHRLSRAGIREAFNLNNRDHV